VSLSWTKSIQSTLSQPISLIPILILSIHLRLVLPNGPFPQDAWTEPCGPLLSSVRAMYLKVCYITWHGEIKKTVASPSNAEVAGIGECNEFCTSGNDTNRVSFQHITFL
jgi:hypothetical protein